MRGYRHLSAVTAALAMLTALPSLPRSAESPGPVPTAVTRTQPVRLAAARHPLNDASGNVWEPDAADAVGGRLTTTASPILDTASPALYQNARRGVTDYRIPVGGPGTYFVDLFAAETRGARPGRRVWDVTAEGHRVATSVDVARAAGQNRAWHVLFSVPVTDTVLNMHITDRHGVAMIGAVEVDFKSSYVLRNRLFDDEFTGRAGAPANKLRWQYDVGGNGFGNGELQSYTNRSANVALNGQGQLFITARREQYTGADGIPRDYTSGRIKTAGRFNFQYGTVTARIFLPQHLGRGLWPAFWALGSNFTSVGWPLCGEMDLMENRGSERSTVHSTALAGRADGTKWLFGAARHFTRSLDWRPHVYKLVWGPNAIAMAVDGRTDLTLSAADLFPGDLWNFNHRFFLILDLAVGGSWPGTPSRRTVFPAVMSIDYVRVYS